MLIEFNMRNNRYINCGFLLLVSLLFGACSSEKRVEGGVPPSSGNVVYEVSYSKETREYSHIGQFLPSNLSGFYNKNGIKMSASIGFGMMKLDIVFTSVDSYIAIDFQDNKMVVPMDQVIIQDSIQSHKDDIMIMSSDSLVDVMGFPSKRLLIEAPVDGAEHNLFVEVYYAPLPDVNNRIAGLPDFNVPGLITAMKINHGSGDVMLMLSELTEAEIDDSRFERPQGFVPATIKDVFALGQLIK